MPRHGKSENEAGSIFLSNQRFILAWIVMMKLIFSHCSLVYSFIICNLKLVFQSFLIFSPFFSFFLIFHFFQSCRLSFHTSPLFSIWLSFFLYSLEPRQVFLFPDLFCVATPCSSPLLWRSRMANCQYLCVEHPGRAYIITRSPTLLW